MKEGKTTSEFKVTVLGIVSSVGAVLWTFAQQNCDLSPEKLIGLGGAILGIFGITAGYTVSRTMLKMKQK